MIMRAHVPIFWGLRTGPHDCITESCHFLTHGVSCLAESRAPGAISHQLRLCQKTAYINLSKVSAVEPALCRNAGLLHFWATACKGNEASMNSTADDGRICGLGCSNVAHGGLKTVAQKRHLKQSCANISDQHVVRDCDVHL